MSVLAFTVLNALLATGLVIGLASVMRVPLVAGRREQVEPVERPAELLPTVHPEPQALTV